MNRKLFYTACCIIVLSFNSFSQEFEKDAIFKNTIIFKIKSSEKNICLTEKIQSNELNNFLSSIKTTEIRKKFPQAKSPIQQKNKFGDKLVDISTIYQIKYDTDIPIEKIIQKLNKFEIVEYAQPVYIDKILSYVPNDPMNGSQYYLNNIKAYDAWEIEKGDTNVVIGIVDTGVDFTHEDLFENIAYNYNDPIDGIDNDNDGFIDNFRGWDVANNDNNPMTEADSHHGTQVSGYAAATSNNGVGISGTGAKCRFLPVKISNSNGTLVNSYEGIVYAAEHGCRIINCSWGSCFGGPYGQDIINYVTFNKNSLVVASAGNSNCGSDYVMYPSAYENVLSVAASNVSDIKWVNSTYGYKVDVTTPGEAVYTTNDGNSYMNGWGTSYASPITAGIAGIVKSHFPNYSALQVGEKIRVTCDNIDAVVGNENFVGMLGHGRTNMYRAITETNTPSVRFLDVKFESSSKNYSVGDTIYISGTYKNYLDDVQNLTATLTSLNYNIDFVNDTNKITSLSTLDTLSNVNNKFSFVINDGSNFDVPIVFKILYNNGTYVDFQYIEVLINSSHLDIYPNKISTTVCANGRIGYNTFYPLTGMGLIYKNQAPLYDCGLIVANSNVNVSSTVDGYQDFITQSRTKIIPNEKVDSMYQSNFGIALNDDFKDIDIKQSVLAWKDSPRDNFLIFEYTIKNNGVSKIDNLYVSLYTDWDLGKSNINKTAFNENYKMGYTYNLESDSLYAGVAVLSNNLVNHYAIDNVDGGNGGINIFDSFTIEEQFFTMTNSRNIAGDGDVIEVTSAGPISIKAGDSSKVAFSLMIADNLYSLNNAAYESHSSYSNYIAVNTIPELSLFNNVEVYPIPSKSIINIKTYGISKIDYEIFNISGKSIFETKNINILQNNNLIKQDISSFEKGFYFIKFNTDLGQIIRKFIVD